MAYIRHCIGTGWFTVQHNDQFIFQGLGDGGLFGAFLLAFLLVFLVPYHQPCSFSSDCPKFVPGKQWHIARGERERGLCCGVSMQKARSTYIWWILLGELLLPMLGLA
ncbi:hypothetical protein QBC44DRAFT_11055 [Cladorrhinum sp. PSN332]|nr:hypothetical protein QBC44DRAFT_11055 [Cladorrhinum sp. PSN332]